MCGVTIKDRISAAVLKERLGICSITNFVRRGRLGWFGHVERKSNDDWVKSCRSLKVSGERGRGRSRKTWQQRVNEYMKELVSREKRPWTEILGILKFLGEPSYPRKRGK